MRTRLMRGLKGWLAGLLLLHSAAVMAHDVWDQVEHRYADSKGVGKKQ